MSQQEHIARQVRFDHSVFLATNPATLHQKEWGGDAVFVTALRASWQLQYAEYIGEKEAQVLVSQLYDTGDILIHEPANTLVAVSDGENAGIASVRPLPGLLLITMLEVLEGYRGLGIGKQLVSALATLNEPLLAHASIHRPDVKAFYQSQGFRALRQSRVDHYGYALMFDVMARSTDVHR